MSDSKTGKLNEWRLAQFHKNNEDIDDMGVDFLCGSPSKLDLGSQDPDTVFLSDSDDDTKPAKSKSNASVITLKDDSPPLEVVMDLNRPGRKRKRAGNIVYTQVSSESENDRDSDKDFIVEQPRRKKTATKKPLKSLPLKPISKPSRKTAVVVPITKYVTRNNKADSSTTDKEPQASCSKQFSELEKAVEVSEQSKSVDLNCESKGIEPNKPDETSPIVKEYTENEDSKSVKPTDDIEAISMTPVKESVSEKGQFTPTTKRIEKLDLLDELLNSPVPRTPVKPMQSVVVEAANIEGMDVGNSTPKTTKIVRPQKKGTEVMSIEDSDSDVPLFEVSPREKNSAKAGASVKPIQQVAETFLRNPPSSPIDATEANKEELQPELINKPMQPMDNGFDNDSSSDSANNNVVKRRLRKGKQPANKRKKVVAKRSRPISESEEEKNDSIQVVSPLKHMTESTTPANMEGDQSTAGAARMSTADDNQADVEEVSADFTSQVGFR